MYTQYIIPVIVVLFLIFKFYRQRMALKKVPLLLKEGAVVVDVRTPAEFKQHANPASVNIPLNEIKGRLQELDKSKPIILCCASGARSGMAAGILKKNGFKTVFNAGRWTNTLVHSHSSAPANS